MKSIISLCSFFCFLLLAGCPNSETPTETPGHQPLEGVKLRLAVVDDPALAAAIVRARGEWTAQTGADFEVVEIKTGELDLKGDSPIFVGTKIGTVPVDAVVCPSHLMGVLAERKMLAPVPKKILRDPEWQDVFELLKLREAAWAKQTVAVPFGSPVFCCYYRADLLKELGHRPPQTWTEYGELARLLSQKGRKGPWAATIEPLAPGWAGMVLMARAAPYAKHRDNYSTLFNIETMEPLVDGPPMIRALEELVAAAKLGPADPFQYDPAAARAAFWRGECGMAITWPTAAKEGREERGEGRRTADPGVRVGFAELPGSKEVFDVSANDWNKRGEDEDPRVPLLVIAGRSGVVSVKSEHQAEAFQLLLWLSDGRMSPQVSAASPATTLFRRSNLKSPGQWVEKPVSAMAAVQYSDATEAALRHEQWLGALRIPGRADYLAALDAAVRAAVRGEKSPKDALGETAAQWREITKKLGIEAQRAAYRHSLGLE